MPTYGSNEKYSVMNQTSCWFLVMLKPYALSHTYMQYRTTSVQRPPCPSSRTRWESKQLRLAVGNANRPVLAVSNPGIMACVSDSTGDGWLYSWWMDVVRCTSCCVSLAILNSGVHQLFTVLVCLFFSAVWVAVLPSARVSLKRLKFYCLDQLQIFFHNEGARTRCSCKVWFSKIHRKAY